MNIFKMIKRYRKRVRFLTETCEWYKTMTGNYRDRHGFRVISKKQIMNFTDNEFLDQLGIIYFDEKPELVHEDK